MLFTCRLDGLVMEGESEDEVVAQVERHLDEEHPELVGKLSREDITAEIREHARKA